MRPADQQRIAAMPLHAITTHYGEAGLRFRSTLEVARIDGVRDRAKVNEALALASRLHAGDRRQREAYINHPLRVALRIMCHYNLLNANVISAALLHDTIEDHAGAMAEEQATQVLQVATGQTPTMHTRVVRVSKTRYGSTQAATEEGKLACGTKPRERRPATDISTDLSDTTCRFCRAEIGLDKAGDAGGRLEALFVVAFTLGMRPGELRTLTWDHVDQANGVIHVWRSARRDGDTKPPKSRRSLQLPNRAVSALQGHKKRQAKERLASGALWQDNDLVFCNGDGRPYYSRALNWRFSRMTERAGIGHWHAHEVRHTAVSIMSHNGVPIQEISDTVGHKSTHVTETVYRHVIVPAIRGGATVMDAVFGDQDTPEDPGQGAASA